MKFLFPVLAFAFLVTRSFAEPPRNGVEAVFEVRPIGWVQKAEGMTTIEVEKQYQPALLGVEDLEAIWVLYWFDRNG